METNKKTIRFFNSVKAKLLLMGLVAIMGIGILSFTMVSILAGINKDTSLKGRLEEISQLQSMTHTLNISYNHSLEKDLLVRMTENLKKSVDLIEASKKDVSRSCRKEFDQLSDTISAQYANSKRIEELAAMRGFQSNVGQYATFIQYDTQIEEGLVGKLNVITSTTLSDTYASLCNSFLAYTKMVGNNSVSSSDKEKIDGLFETLKDEIGTYVLDEGEKQKLLEMLDKKKAVFKQITALDDKIVNARKENMQGKDSVTVNIATIEQKVQESVNNRNRFAGILIAVILIIVIGIVGYMTVWTTKNISGNLSMFGKMLDEFSNGNLSMRSNIVSQDEFGIFSQQLNSFANKLTDVLGQIQLLINEVGNKNLVVANMMRKVANGSDSNQVLEDEGIIYLKKLFDEITENVVNQSANIEESLAALRQQAEVNGEIVKVVEAAKIEKNDENSSKDLYQMIKEQNISLNEISVAIEQISDEGVEIIDKTKMTNRVTSEIADELLNSIETINEVITSSEELREKVAFFKF